MVGVGADFWVQDFAISATNVFGALTFIKDQAPKLMGIVLPWWLGALAVVQGVAGAFLVFLIGLALRNRFRMK